MSNRAKCNCCGSMVNFRREDYLDESDYFESGDMPDATEELCEFNNNAEDIAYELAYTRYALAKLEREVKGMKGVE